MRFVVSSFLRWVHLPWRWVAGDVVGRVHDAYDDADLLVSAPGGPYFGDIYASHEPVHWLYVLLARGRGVPAVLYAPSAGPFERRWMRPFRRRVFRTFRRVAVREERSASHLRDLMGTGFAVEVTADAALQVSVAPLDRAHWIVDGASLEDRTVIVASVIDWSYRDDEDPGERRLRHDEAVVAALAPIAGACGAHVAFVPQLHGRKRDRPYLETLASRLRACVPETVTVEVVDDTLDSDEQRARFASADFVLAGRYHPAVFSVGAAVPLVCIPYEHKAAGLMEAAGVGDLSIPIDDVTEERLVALVATTFAGRDAVRLRLADGARTLHDRSARSSDIAVECIERRG